jgi:N-acetylglucosamine kinase-like BadF-type ATPase
VDAGNTKTIALVATLGGEIVGRGRGGTGDIYCHLHLGVARSAELALRSVEEAVVSALEMAGARAEDLRAGAFSMAGADWPEDFELLREEMARRRLGRTVLVVNDALGALRAGSPDGMGVSVACGTGLAIGARAADGSSWHHSFWLESGGSLDLGHKALRAVYRSELGITPPTALTARALEIFGERSVEGVLHSLTRREGRLEASPAMLGKVTRALLDEAQAGDPVALQVVQAHGEVLGEYALAAARRVNLERGAFPLVLAGGVLRHQGRQLSEAIVRRVRAGVPGVEPLDSRFEPAVGAVLLALEAAGVEVDDALLARLVPTLPEPSLYLT